MKNKRLYAIILLAALTLLQMRVTFAACDTGAQQPVDSSAAAPCVAAPCDHAAIDIAMPAAGDVALVCPPSACVEQYAAQAANHSTLLDPGFSALAQAPPSGPFSSYVSDAHLHASVTPGHPAHTRLIYVLQRLLI